MFAYCKNNPVNHADPDGNWIVDAFFLAVDEGEFSVSRKFKEILEAEMLTGIYFRPVYTIGDDSIIAYQMVCNNILPPVHPLTKLELEAEESVTGFKSYTIESNSPTYYTNKILNVGKDFNRSFEFYGIGIYPRQDVIVSQSVRKLIIKNKIKGIDFEPVFILE
jgi:hypothetical protein